MFTRQRRGWRPHDSPRRLESAAMANSEAGLAEVEALYRKTVRGAFEHLTFKGLTHTGQPVSLPLEEVYVGLKVLAEVPEVVDDLSAAERRLLHEAKLQGRLEEEQDRELDSLRYRRWREEARGEQTRLQRRSLDATQVELAEPVMVLLGDPGSGKTTLLHYLALRAIGPEQTGGTRKGRLPLFVPLAAYDEHLRRTDDTATLEQFLAIYWARWSHLRGLEPLFHQALEEGRALVLLDGLDEVLELTTRRRVAQQVSGLLQKWEGRGNRFVLTSRFIGYREVRLPGGVPHYMVLDFGPEEIERFAHRWCEAFEVLASGGERSEGVLQRARQEAQALLEDVQEKPGVAHLASNPLLLTMLAQLRRQEGRLPARRIELYARYVRMLLEHWAERVQPDVAHQHLMDLALWLQRHRPSGTARQSDLVKVLRHQEMRDIAGLLGERGHDAHGFLHLTFQEYFVGRALARESPENRWELLRPHLHDPRWHEPLLLCAGQLGVIEGREEEVDDLLGRILGAGSEHEEVLHRDLFLAIAVLEEDVTRSKKRLSDMMARLEPLRMARVPSVRQRALAGMAQLMRLGHEPAKEAFLAWIEEQAHTSETSRALAKVPPGEIPAELRGKLLEWLEREGGRKWIVAVDVLGPMAGSDEAVLQALLPRIDDDSPGGPPSVVWALGRVAGSSEAVRDAFLARLADKEFDVGSAMIQALSAMVSSDEAVRQAFFSRLADELPHVREAAAEALGALADRDESVRQALLSRLTDENWPVRSSAACALGAMAGSDEFVRQALLARLADEDSDVREAVVDALSASVGNDESVRDALLSRLTDEDWLVRRAAAEALGAVAGSSEAVRQALLARLDDEVPHVREVAALALSTAVGSDEAVRQALLSMLDDENYGVRRVAAEALGAVAGSDGAVRQALLSVLDDEQGEVRRAVSETLGTQVGSDEAVRQALLSRLGGERWEVRSASVRVLGAMVGSDGSVRQALLERLDDEHWQIREAAVEALGAVVGSDGAVRQALLERLDDEDPDVCEAAVEALGAVVGSDGAIRQALLDRLADEHWWMREVAAEALGAVAGSDGAVREALLARLDDETSDVRSAAAKALEAAVAGSDGTVRQALLARLTDKHEKVRRAAVQALGAVVGSDGAVRQALLSRLNDEDGFVRQAAAKALEAVAGSDKAVQQALFALLDERELGVIQVAVEVLGTAAGSDGSVRQVLLARLADEHGFLRRAAAEALGAVVDSDGSVRKALLAQLDDNNEWVRAAAVRALGAVVGSDGAVREALLARLNDKVWTVRAATVMTLSEKSRAEDVPVESFIPWLGAVGYSSQEDLPEQVRRSVARVVALEAHHDEHLLRRLLEWVRHPEWETRQGAAMALMAIPGGPPPHAKPALLGLLDDLRDEGAWSERLDMAESLLNARDREASKKAIDCAMSALDYGIQPWHDGELTGQVRSRAAELLGRLEPTHRNERVLQRLLRLLQEDDEEDVCDTAYQAALRLIAAPVERR
ncbi:HEAT repeat domain-containing protein [Archangium violaceum]|uniref:HEAT repeat domain-containing protein n=1 Tax=Archangium violaceum TaxID=83451 RepID=UPI00193B4507|nr:HEAT repeat domain-containing protein [Archangium violaceum]QRK06372.1 HEAT repeat domain-containing protein [Archangium violaceum]